MWTIKDGNIILDPVPLKGKRYNPYEEDGGPGFAYDAVAGLVEPHRWGLVHMIDMDYKDKPDQWTDIFVEWEGSEDSFREWCMDNGVIVISEECDKVGCGCHGADAV
jgi:hypothetical protein